MVYGVDQSWIIDFNLCTILTLHVKCPLCNTPVAFYCNNWAIWRTKEQALYSKLGQHYSVRSFTVSSKNVLKWEELAPSKTLEVIHLGAILFKSCVGGFRWWFSTTVNHFPWFHWPHWSLRALCRLPQMSLHLMSNSAACHFILPVQDSAKNSSWYFMFASQYFREGNTARIHCPIISCSNNCVHPSIKFQWFCIFW